MLFLYRDAYYDNGEAEPTPPQPNASWQKTATARWGRSDLGWDGAHTRFTNVDYSHNG